MQVKTIKTPGAYISLMLEIFVKSYISCFFIFNEYDFASRISDFLIYSLEHLTQYYKQIYF